MGAWLEFRCEWCGYEAMVSGRDDVGLVARTTTVLCEDCEALYDVVMSRSTMGTEKGGDRSEIEPECPKSSRHTVRRGSIPVRVPSAGTR